jgi:rhodanese-related sulfurtransferase
LAAVTAGSAMSEDMKGLRAGEEPRIGYHFTVCNLRVLSRMAFIEKNYLLILALFVSGAMLLWPLIQRRFSPVKEIGNLNVTHLMNHQNAVLLDVREAGEFSGGKLPGAVHIPLSQLKDRGPELAKMNTRPIVVYCSRGRRSRGAGTALASLGFASIYQLHGGLQAWKDAGLPLENTNE